MGAAVSAAERRVSPASIPKPPEYVGRAGERAISIEKYAMLRWVRSGTSKEGASERLMRGCFLFLPGQRRLLGAGCVLKVCPDTGIIGCMKSCARRFWARYASVYHIARK